MRFRETAAARNGKRLTLAGLLLLATLLVAGCSLLPEDDSGQKGGTSDEPAAASPTEKPNIVFILTDDMRKDDLEHMPQTKELIQKAGVTFDNAFVSYPLCCPARATFLTGQYTHNHRVLTNAPRDQGGEERFRELGGDKSTIATWLDGAGYKTAHVGKYLNGYGISRDTYIPPGWDEWYTLMGRYHVNLNMNENGKIEKYDGSIDSLIERKSEDVLKRNVSGDKPFYLQIDTHAPHGPYDYPARYADDFRDAKAPRPPSFDEPNISDKPGWVRENPRLSESDEKDIDAAYRGRLRGLLQVDDMVASVTKILRDAGKLDNTYIVFTSDNGFHLGEHRFKVGKWTPYEESIRVPLVVRGPGIKAGANRKEMVINNDFAPTFADMGGTGSPGVDGRSFLPLLRGESVPWRSQFLVESWHARLPSSPPTYQAIRTEDMIFTRYRADPPQLELYNLRKDPYQLENQMNTADPALVGELRSRLQALSTCKTAECRALEDRPIGK